MRFRLTDVCSRGVCLATFFIALSVFLVGCDQQLEEESFDQITSGSFFQNEEQFRAAATGVYAQLRSVPGDVLDIQEHTSDELMVPTRGPDWGDGGIWRDLTQHNFTKNTPQISGSFDALQVGVARANGVLSTLAPSDALPQEKKDRFAGEVRFLRAYYYHWLMDQFGGVPIVVEEGSDLDFETAPVDPNDPPEPNSRAEVFNFILQELTGCTAGNFDVSSCIENPGDGTIIASLGTAGSQDVAYGQATRGAAYALTARLLLNAEIYTGTVSESGVETGTALYRGAAAAAQQVIGGPYRLEDYFDNFTANNRTSGEIVFAATYAPEPNVGNAIYQDVLHYNPISPGGFNGFTTIPAFYRSYNPEPGDDGRIGTQDDGHPDVRGRSFLVGQQYAQPNEACIGDECFSDPTSTPIQVRGGDDAAGLNYTLEIPSIQLGDVQSGNLPSEFPATSDAFILEAPGARPLKFEIDPSRSGALMGNDFPLFRLAEMYLIRAEALTAANGGSPTGAALTAFNTVHEQRGNDALTMGEATDGTGMYQHLVAERGRELVSEGTRRSDLIRYEFAHGGEAVGYPGSSDAEADVYAPTFTGPWLFKKDGTQTGQSSEPFRVLFPLPEGELSTNPNLQQNPGYN
jgi:hypothetical protein